MTCPTITDVSCYINGIAGSVAGPVSSGFLSTLASAVRSGLTWVFTNSATLWLKVPSPYLTSDQPELAAVHQWLFPVTAAVAVGGAVAAGARMALSRKHGPLLDLSGGLAIIGLVAALGTLLPTMLMQAGDAWTSWVLSASTGGDFTKRLNMLLSAGYGHDIPDIVVIFFGAAAMVASAVQAALLLFRQAAVLVLAGVLPLAAAGALAPATRNWIRKIAGWMLALICYKPAAACVYATAFTMIGSASGWRALLTGFAMIILSIVALPVFIRFFTWTVGTVASVGSGGAGQFLGLAAAGALGLGALRGGGAASSGTAAIRQAEYMSPPPDGGDAGGGNHGSGPERPGGGNPPGGAAGITPLSGAPDSGRTPRGGSTAHGRWPQGGQSASADAGPGGSPGAAGPGRAGQGGTGRAGTGGRAASESGSLTGGVPGAGSPVTGAGAGAGAPNGAGTWRDSGPGSSGATASGRRGEDGGQGTPGAASFAGLFAAQAMASGARDAAAATAEEEERR